MKKLLSIILTIVMLLSVVPLGAVTANAATSGTTGDCTWTLDGTVLTISGNGVMGNYSSSSIAPWGTNITEVIIGDDVSIVGANSFADCKSLSNVTIGESVVEIKYDAFKECSGVTNVNFNAELCNSMATYDEDSDWRISVFKDCSNLKSIIIGNKVTSIPNYAFSGCGSLESIIIPDSVNTIGYYAFRACRSLSNVELSNNVEEIKEGTFYQCESLTNIKISDNIKTIDDDAFNYSMMSCFTVSDKNENFTAIDGVLFDKDKSILIKYPIAKNDVEYTVPNGVTEVASSAFFNCQTVTSVNMPNSITKINSYAFYNCRNLNNIKLSENISSIGYRAFYNCEKLISVRIPNSVKEIGNYAFDSCSLLADINIPNGVETIEDGAFRGCSSLISIIIPDSVKNLGSSVFSGCEKLESVTLPSSIDYISSGLFRDCENLTYITIPSGVKTIGGSAFQYCYGLTNVNLPEGVITIGDSAFKDCGILTDINIPDSVIRIGSSAFYGTAYYYNEENWVNDQLYIDNCLIKIRDSSIEELVIDNNTRVIALGALSSCENLKKLTIPFVGGSLSDKDNMNFGYAFGEEVFIEDPPRPEDYVPSSLKEVIVTNATEIGRTGFRNCNNITSITLPNNIISIYAGAFDGCARLGSIIIEEENQYFASIDGVLFNKDKTELIIYPSGKKQEKYIIPNDIKNIHYNAFNGATSLKDITIPSNVEYIGDDAFSGCNSLEMVNITDMTAWCNIEFVGYGSNPLEQAGNLYLNGNLVTDLVIPDDVSSINFHAFYNCDSIKNIIVSDGVLSIGDEAFANCYNLENLTIGKSVADFNQGIIANCQKLKNINVSESNVNYSSVDGVLFNKKKSELIKYPRANANTNYNIPNGVSVIKYSAFDNCDSLISVQLPESVESICDGAFYSCDSLVTMNIPQNVKNIGHQAFSWCANLENVVVGNGVTQVGFSAFEYCNKLSSIKLPDSVESIGAYAFNNTAFYNNNNNWNEGVLYIGNHLIEAKNISGDYIIKNGTKTISPYAFSNCYIKSIEIPNSVVSIGGSAFSSCESLKKIIIPSSVNSIGGSAFIYCHNLETVEILGNVEIIKSATFSVCTSLKNVTFPKSLKEIEVGAFYDCRNLTNIYYAGSESDKEKIFINYNIEKLDNEALKDVTWHYNCGITCEHIWNNATCTVPKTCKVCGEKTGSKLAHKYDNACDATCNVCNAKRTVSAHKYTNNCDTDCNICGTKHTTTHNYDNACDATCNVCNAKRTVPAHKYTNKCDTTCNVCKAARKITHTYKTTTTKATLSKNGKVVKQCTVCKDVASSTVIKYAKTIKLSSTSYTYNGKVKTPTVTVKDSAGKTLKKNTDYTVTYPAGRKNAGTYKVKVVFKGKYSGTSNLTFKINPIKSSKLTAKLSASSYTYNGNAKKPTVTVKNSAGKTVAKTNYTVTYQKGRKNVGKYKVVIKFKGNYSGTKALYFTVNPGKTPVKKLTAGKKSLTVAITKKSAQVTGYQIQYSKTKDFKASKSKIKTVKSYKTTSVKLTGLTAKKTYYVRVRTFKKVGNKTYYSGWSTAKSMKTK